MSYDTRLAALAEARREYKLHTGKVLPNGGVVLASRRIRSGNEFDLFIVLCLLPHNKHDPFVTWVYRIDTEQRATGGYGPMAYASSGNYMRTIDDAVHDYNTRK